MTLAMAQERLKALQANHDALLQAMRESTTQLKATQNKLNALRDDNRDLRNTLLAGKPLTTIKQFLGDATAQLSSLTMSISKVDQTLQEQVPVMLASTAKLEVKDPHPAASSTKLVELTQ